MSNTLLLSKVNSAFSGMDTEDALNTHNMHFSDKNICAVRIEVLEATERKSSFQANKG